MAGGYQLEHLVELVQAVGVEVLHLRPLQQLAALLIQAVVVAEDFEPELPAELVLEEEAEAGNVLIEDSEVWATVAEVELAEQRPLPELAKQVM